jgi:hypothetical protein
LAGFRSVKDQRIPKPQLKIAHVADTRAIVANAVDQRCYGIGEACRPRFLASSAAAASSPPIAQRTSSIAALTRGCVTFEITIVYPPCLRDRQ